MPSIKAIFEDRKSFDKLNKKFELPVHNSLYTKYYIDTWNIIPFYGKVDTAGIPVIPKQDLLRFCSYGTDTTQIKVLQPVTEYFFSLRFQYEKYYKLGNINKNSPYFKSILAPTAGYLDSNNDYFDILQTIYRNFIDYLTQNKIINSVRTYSDFIEQLLIYTKIQNSYLTRAGYVESYDYSLLHTGLAIEIYKGDIDKEGERSKFFKDINHLSFLELCTRSNMKIDREIPWRIFLDIRTITRIPDPDPKILSFSNKNDVFPRIEDPGYIPDFQEDIQKFFDVYYNKVVPYDENSYVYFEEFVTILQSFYNSFSKTFPNYKKYNVNNCGNSNVLDLKRQDLNEDFVAYDRKKYVDLYLKFRNVELSKVVDNDILENYLNLANQLYSINQSFNKPVKDSVIASIKYYTDAIGTLAYRSPSLYELDEKSKMP